jgi:O-antigen biosynthesis protein WbqP
MFLKRACHMAFAVPAPAIPTLHDLVSARAEQNVRLLPPGLTGQAQVNGRDELAISDKVTLGAGYLRRRSFLFDLRIPAMTVIKVGGAVGIQH